MPAERKPGADFNKPVFNIMIHPVGTIALSIAATAPQSTGFKRVSDVIVRDSYCASPTGS
jgi:hypothetical protein